MPDTNVFLNKLTNAVPEDVKQKFLKMIEDQIQLYTGLKNSVTQASSVLSQPQVVIAMYDVGNQKAQNVMVMGSAIRIKTIAFFLQHSVILMPSDIDVTLSSSTVKL